MTWRSLVSREGCYILYVTDDAGRLLAIFAATHPDEFRWVSAKLCARLTIM